MLPMPSFGGFSSSSRSGDIASDLKTGDKTFNVKAPTSKNDLYLGVIAGTVAVLAILIYKKYK